MEKIVEQGMLYDFYGSLLTKHQQEIYERIVYDNLSLSEVAEEEDISKQAVHDLVRRCTSAMREYEEKLGMIRRYEKVREDAQALLKAAKNDESVLLRRQVTELAGQIIKDIS